MIRRPPRSTLFPYTTLFRSRLVHFKPPRETQLVSEQYPKQYFGDLVNDLSLAEQCLSCVGDMIRELNRLAGGSTDVPKFLSGDKYLSSVWRSEERRVGKECRSRWSPYH